MPHTRENFFYRKPSSLSKKLFFDVGSTLIKIQRKSEKTIWKADFEYKFLQRVKFQSKNNTTRQILIWKFYNASDFNLKKLQQVRFWIKIFFDLSDFEISKNFPHSKNHILVHFTPWKRHILHLSWFHRKLDFALKISLRVRFWIER